MMSSICQILHCTHFDTKRQNRPLALHNDPKGRWKADIRCTMGPRLLCGQTRPSIVISHPQRTSAPPPYRICPLPAQTGHTQYLQQSSRPVSLSNMVSNMKRGPVIRRFKYFKDRPSLRCFKKTRPAHNPVSGLRCCNIVR